MDLTTLMKRFRLADRELFNHYFHIEDPYNHPEAWDIEEGFRRVQRILFEEMVQIPADLPDTPYFSVQSDIRVLPTSSSCPAMINREIDCGYWDHPVEAITQDATLHFIHFFDWDTLAQRDYQYVRAVIADWPAHPELVGKHTLAETMYVSFAKAPESSEDAYTGLHLVPAQY